MALLIFYVTLALGVSFLCSILEAVLLSVTPSFVARAEVEYGQRGLQLALLKADIDRPLAAILSLNTIAHTVGAAGAGAQATIVFGSQYIGAASAVLTFLILVISEIIPKTLGAVHWRKLAMPATTLLRPMMWIMWPFVKLAQGLTRLVAGDSKQITIHRNEFTALAEIGFKEGVLGEHESKILANLFRFAELKAGDVMTPRTVIFALPAGALVRDILADVSSSSFSRIPVFSHDKDHIEGFVMRSDVLLRAAGGDASVPLSEFMQSITAVSESTPLQDLFEKLIKERTHIAVVLGEYGGTSGLVTLEDVVETLLGMEIMDEADSIADMQLHARERWRKRVTAAGVDVSSDRGDEVV